MPCILQCITTDNYNVFCFNIVTFQLAETKDLIHGCWALISDYQSKFRTLKTGFIIIKTNCWSMKCTTFTQAKLGLEPGLGWFVLNATEKPGVDWRVAQCLLQWPIPWCSTCQETSATLEGSSHLKNRDISKIIILQ